MPVRDQSGHRSCVGSELDLRARSEERPNAARVMGGSVAQLGGGHGARLHGGIWPRDVESHGISRQLMALGPVVELQRQHATGRPMAVDLDDLGHRDMSAAGQGLQPTCRPEPSTRGARPPSGTLKYWQPVRLSVCRRMPLRAPPGGSVLSRGLHAAITPMTSRTKTNARRRFMGSARGWDMHQLSRIP